MDLLISIRDFLLSLLSKDEWLALALSFWLGVAATEAVKRLARVVITAAKNIPNEYAWNSRGMFQFMGTVITGTTTYVMWPPGEVSVVDNPVVMALVNGFSAPICYRLLIAALRRRGCGWLAAAITGDRRSENLGPPDGVERRRD